MSRSVFLTLQLLLPVACWLLCPRAASAQDAVLVTCSTTGGCTCMAAYSPSVSGSKSVRVVSTVAGRQQAKGRSVQLASMTGLYRHPESGELHVLGRDGQVGELVMPAKLPRADTTSADPRGWTFEYRAQPSSKTPVSVPTDQFVALLRGPRAEGALVEFLKYQLQVRPAHPRLEHLIAAIVLFAGRSEDLRLWRDDLMKAMHRSLELYKSDGVEPALMERTLAEGVATTRVYRAVAPAESEEPVEKDLANEYRKLLERFAIAAVLKNAGLQDSFLEKLHQIGLARWSRPELIKQSAEALEASARLHHQRALQLFAAGQYGLAFDEARLASSRAPCNQEMNEFYNRARVEFVHRNMVPSLPEYDNENLTVLQQIVRELQSFAREPDLTPEKVQYIRKRISEGERLDTGYLPLQLKKAEFLANIGELTASREVVTQVERTVHLGRNDADEWLNMDANLNGKLLTLRQATERKTLQLIANGEFKEALNSAALGLMAEPDNPRFLYLSAVAAAVLRNREQAARFAQGYFRLLTPDCGSAPDTQATLIDIYRLQPTALAGDSPGGWTPNWVSGARYAPGETFYDPVSGSFNARIITALSTKGTTTSGTEFRWEGFLAAAIQSSTRGTTGERRILLELEPVYAETGVYMTGIGTRANSEGRRRVIPLRYINSPDFDPLLAAKFTGKSYTRGWAGNPFFHPFLWNDIFVFDLVYDALGRIKEAIPVAPDPSHPISSFSERLTFTWEGDSKRLLAISGARYRRELNYNKNGRLIWEKITHPSGQGKIEYEYGGDSPELIRAACEDDFYDRSERTVIVQPPVVR